MNHRRCPARGRIRAWVAGAGAITVMSCAALLPLGCVKTVSDNFMPAAPEARLGDCATAEQGVELSPYMIADFEAANAQATYLYTYTDNTSTISPSGYQPATEVGTHCASDPGHGVFHFKGGPFLGWGGGLGVSMLHLGQGNGGGGLCAARPLPSYCYLPGPDPNVTNSILDMSQWDGVAVWAKRGPNSQPLLRVLVGNKYTDDDISFFMYVNDPTQPRYCERVRECACINSLPCAYAAANSSNLVPGDGGSYCGTPGVVMGPDISTGNGTPTNTCGVTRCNDIYAAHPENGPDPQFANHQCRPYTYRSGITTNLCYDPDAGAQPAESDQQCGDHWTFPLHLTTEWKLYLVPFASMFQQGFAKRFPFFDLKSVSVVRLTWDAGPVDFYVDDWRFYRLPRANDASAAQ
jgi:hypothetical protein